MAIANYAGQDLKLNLRFSCVSESFSNQSGVRKEKCKTAQKARLMSPVISSEYCIPRDPKDSLYYCEDLYLASIAPS